MNKKEVIKRLTSMYQMYREEPEGPLKDVIELALKMDKSGLYNKERQKTKRALEITIEILENVPDSRFNNEKSN